MMGPTDPMAYLPTWQLCVAIIFIFCAIYGVGRVAEYLLRQLFLCMKYLLLSFIGLYYDDDYESSNNSEDEEKRRKRKATKSIVANEEMNSSKAVILTQSNGVTEKTTIPIETTLTIDTDNLNESRDESMRNSPTDDEEKSKNSNSSSPSTIRHRKTVKHPDVTESSHDVTEIISSQ